MEIMLTIESALVVLIPEAESLLETFSQRCHLSPAFVPGRQSKI
jgi:hypothetical protein